MVSRCKYVSINADLIKEAVVKKKKKKDYKKQGEWINETGFQSRKTEKEEEKFIVKTCWIALR